MNKPKHYSQYRFRRPEEEKKDENDDFHNLYPYVLPTLIFFGIARLSFYYSRFNINILYYLDLSEIVTSFFDIVILIAITVSILSTIINFDISFRSKKMHTFFTPLKSIIIMGLGVGVYFLVVNEILMDYILIIIFFLLIWIILMGIYSYRSIKDNENRTSSTNDIVFLFSFTFTLAILALWVATWLDAKTIKDYKRYLGVKVVYSDTTKPLFSDSTTYYIGNTSNYLFIYNQKEDITTVQKMDNVKTIQFPKINPKSIFWKRMKED